MAPEIALKALAELPEGATVLDPMVGSGTVMREAVLRCHDARGYDLDPLAVLISKVSTRRIRISRFEETFESLIADAASLKKRDVHLPWIDECEETSTFVEYWFSEPQKSALRSIAYCLDEYDGVGADHGVVNALKVALSRTIITKTVGASLAWDISHSRPHKMRETNDYDVFAGYRASVERMAEQLVFEQKEVGRARIGMGDARNLHRIADASIDAVVTSPPYLNAIDYLRGHKFSLVWFGYSIPALREVRAHSIGAERASEAASDDNDVQEIREEIVKESALPGRYLRLVERYILDAVDLMSEISRVLKRKKGRAVLVVGNSCLKGVYIRNSAIFERAADLFGLELVSSSRRQLRNRSRYLPMPKGKADALGKRMRHEVVLAFSN
jgi:hypothetical protein